MLDFRNDKEIVNNGENMRIIAAAAHEENKSMALLATKSQKDSRIIKVPTIITMLYLPASLVAVFVLPQALDNDWHTFQTIFSSNLVEFKSSKESPKDTEHPDFHVVENFWIYPVLSLVLLLGTFLIIYVWDKTQTMRRPKDKRNTSDVWGW